MRLKDVQIGETYYAKVSGRVVLVRILRPVWDAYNKEMKGAEMQEIIERILDDLDKLSREIREEQYVHVSRAVDAIRELAAELEIEVGIYGGI